MIDHAAPFARERLAGYSEEILDRHVLLLGAGALGAAISYLLTMWGFRSATIVDFDVYEESNATRTLDFPWARVRSGSSVAKAQELAKLWRRRLAASGFRLYDIRSRVAFVQEVAPEDWNRADIVFCAVDHPRARYDAAVLARIYAKDMVMGGFDAVSGQLTVHFVGGSAAACYGCPSVVPPQYAAASVSCTGFGLRERESQRVPATPTLAASVASLMVHAATERLSHRLNPIAAQTLRLNLQDPMLDISEQTMGRWYRLCPNDECRAHGFDVGPVQLGPARCRFLGGLLRLVDAAVPGGEIVVIGGFVVNTLDSEGRLLRVCRPGWATPREPSYPEFELADPTEPPLVLESVGMATATAYNLLRLPVGLLGLRPGAKFIVRNYDGARTLYEWVRG